MKVSQNRILTTQVGSLPRSKAVTDVVFGRENELDSDPGTSGTVIRNAVLKVVRRQIDTGIDIASDGEMSKIS